MPADVGKFLLQIGSRDIDYGGTLVKVVLPICINQLMNHFGHRYFCRPCETFKAVP